MAEETIIQNGNPYDLVDHPDQVENNETNQNGVVENNETKESGQFVKKIVKLIAKKFGLPDPETGESLKNVTEGQLETENKEQTPNNTETTLEQDIVAQEEAKAQDEQVKQEQVEKKNFSFENVMLGVSGVLNKIEKKVENTTGIELESPLKKVEESPANETDNLGETNTPITEPEQPMQSVQPTAEQVTNPEINENPVEKNNEEYLSENH